MSGAEQALDGATKRLTKMLADTIPQGPHPNPYDEFVRVRLDIVQESIDHLDWLDNGVDEWRALWKGAANKSRASEATALVAIRHLHAVLNKARTFDEKQAADTAARAWLVSIGSEPS